MAYPRKRTTTSSPARGRRPGGRRAKAGEGRRRKGAHQKRTGSKHRAKRRSFTPEERRASVEAFLKSGLTLQDFGRLWDLTPGTIGRWVRIYNEKGPKGLERKPHAAKGKMRIAKAVREEIVHVKRVFPTFGLKRLRDHLFRFRGVKVSTGSIGKTLKEAKVPPTPTPKKRRKVKKKVRRFERAKPGALWQSDITSYVLTRHGARAYLTVFLDDHSRYVVSFALALHQKQELVMEALLLGIDRFGKPVEVLTDQGRQYVSWRGRSFFQKYLEKQGIHHVVSRSHHPQTLGKCERLWKTINEEYWSRARPQEIGEARDGLTHFFAHYNHHRPHQGIGGMVPADRFFGVESDVRKALEARLSENELRLALGEQPRRGVYLVGQIGGQAVSMHGERGRLVIQGPEGNEETFEPKELGMPQEDNDERRAVEEAERASSKDGAVPGTEESRGVCAGPLGVGERGGTGACPQGGNVDPGDVAGTGEPHGGGGAPGDPADPGVAAVAAGAVGDGGRAFEAAEREGEEGARGERGKFLEPAQANREDGQGTRESPATGGAFEGHAGASAERETSIEEPCPGAEPWKDGYPVISRGQSADDCGRAEPERTKEEPWRRPTE